MDYYGYRAIFDSLAKGVKRLPSDSPSDYTVISKGSAGHDVLYRGTVVGTVMTGKAKDAISALLDEQNRLDAAAEERRRKALASKPERDAKRRDADTLKAVMSEKRTLIENAHRNKRLSFKPLSSEEFRSKESILIHKSRSYGKRGGSEYRLVMVDGKPAYARESDHWGRFHTEGWKDGEGVSTDYEWTLPGVTTKYGEGKRYAGYILLSDLG